MGPWICRGGELGYQILTCYVIVEVKHHLPNCEIIAES